MENNKSKIGLVLLVVALLGATGYVMFSGSQSQQPPAGGEIVRPDGQSQAMRTPVLVALGEQNGSGQAGKVELTEKDGKTVVTISVTPGPAGVPQPAHIHAGTCTALGDVKYQLNPVIDGKSTTTLAPVLHFIHGLGQTAVNVHKSADQASVYVACGDLAPQFDAAMLPAD